MPYTLSMAADQGIRISDDGVAEVSMTEARALLTRLIRTVREEGRKAAFTERGERRAYVVPPAYVEAATMTADALLRLVRHVDAIPEEQRTEGWARDLIQLRNEVLHR